MYGVQVTVAGNAVTPIEYQTAGPGYPTARFRLAGTVREFDRARGRWTEAYTDYYTVWAQRTLAQNLASSVTIGEPLIVRGTLRVRESEGGDGRGLASVDLLATAIGHDLSYGTSAFARVSRAKPGLTADGSDAGRRAVQTRGQAQGQGQGQAPRPHTGADAGTGRGMSTGTGTGTDARGYGPRRSGAAGADARGPGRTTSRSEAGVPHEDAPVVKIPVRRIPG
ncbi:single-stranded DNA-binding protein [Streptomyces armeniacus]|uniref:Single-stranded DNA-binding protein n=1 Tax=Streptomyces armeniacus TaxID=83291 RepID=A0A345XXK1_9ACTN|nr:single-stranded DNA-binding protein [Streptomyces armeniacus]AXK36367.1 single-stranded DNA-binding protein [Streptomyces armeniacus]